MLIYDLNTLKAIGNDDDHGINPHPSHSGRIMGMQI
jgi:hypothetical protein